MIRTIFLSLLLVSTAVLAASYPPFYELKYGEARIVLYEDGSFPEIVPSAELDKTPCAFANVIGWRITVEEPSCQDGICGRLGVNFMDNILDHDQVWIPLTATGDKCTASEKKKGWQLPDGCFFEFPITDLSGRERICLCVRSRGIHCQVKTSSDAE